MNTSSLEESLIVKSKDSLHTGLSDLIALVLNYWAPHYISTNKLIEALIYSTPVASIT